MTASTPAIVDGEQRARKCGRRFAKQIFQAPLPQWKLIGTHATDHVEIFEDTATHQSPTSGATTRSVRAVRKLTGHIDDVETVLSATHKSQLYAKLLPDLYSSGGCIADYGLLKHATDEREHANVQFAMHHAHVWQHAEPGASSRLDHHLYVEYSLLTQLQRTQVAVSGDGTKSSVTMPVPSLLYVLRPVHVPSFSDRHHEFAPHRLAKNQLSVTYVIQQEDNGKLSLEVVLTCSFAEPEQFASVRASHTSEMWRVVVALTRLQPLIDGMRLGREQFDELEQEKLRRRTVPAMDHADPYSARGGMPSRGTEIAGSARNHHNHHATADRSSTRHKVKEKLFGHRSRKTSGASGFETDESEDEVEHGKAITQGGCVVCHKKFHAFRWKKKCEVCLQGVCDQCLSTIANPAAMRKKKRVCGACLYGGTNSGFERITDRNNADLATDALRAAQEVRYQRARTMDAPTTVASRSSQRVSPNQVVADRSSRRYTAPDEARRRAQTTGSRLPAAAAVVPPPRPTPAMAPVVSAASVPFVAASRTPPTPSGVSTSWASEEQSTLTNPESEGGEPANGAEPENPYKSNSFYDETDPSGIVSDDEFVVTNRARRAQTIEIGDVHIKRVEKKRSMSRATPSASETRARGRSFSTERTPLDLSDFTLRLSKKKSQAENNTTHTVVSTKRATMQFRQLKTPPVSYDLDFDWINPFPKAPIAQGAKERGRVEYMSSQLKLNAHTAMVYLRRDSVLEELTQQVVGSLATQWDGCSIHLVGERQVFCLAYSYQEPLPVGDEAIEVVTEDVVTREECPSSYALYHQSAFFVPNLNDDVRFRAHPLHTDAHVVSYLSLPIFGASGSRPCMGTLDLWRFDPSGVSSHVSHDWWSKMERVLNKIAVRIEELSLSHAGHTMPSYGGTRVHKARSVGSTDSRSSTRKDDSSESDLRDLAEEEELRDDEEYDHDADNDDSDTEYELHGGWTTSPAPVSAGRGAVATRQRRHTVADQMETRGNENGSFMSGRGSAASASSLDFETTIESLLNQARLTSQFVREQTRRSSSVDVDC